MSGRIEVFAKTKQMDILQYHDDPIVKWDVTTLCLRGNQQDKVEQYIKLGLIERVSWGEWKVRPLPKNHQTHKVLLLEDGRFWCDCQWNRKMELNCAHIKAVVVFEGLNKSLTQDEMFRILGVHSQQELAQMMSQPVEENGNREN